MFVVARCGPSGVRAEWGCSAFSCCRSNDLCWRALVSVRCFMLLWLIYFNKCLLYNVAQHIAAEENVLRPLFHQSHVCVLASAFLAEESPGSMRNVHGIVGIMIRFVLKRREGESRGVGLVVGWWCVWAMTIKTISSISKATAIIKPKHKKC